jgi:hypothetical protein
MENRQARIPPGASGFGDYNSRACSGPAYAPASGAPLSRFRRSRISLPVLKNGTLF